MNQIITADQIYLANNNQNLTSAGGNVGQYTSYGDPGKWIGPCTNYSSTGACTGTWTNPALDYFPNGFPNDPLNDSTHYYQYYRYTWNGINCTALAYLAITKMESITSGTLSPSSPVKTTGDVLPCSDGPTGWITTPPTYSWLWAGPEK